MIRIREVAHLELDRIVVTTVQLLGHVQPLHTAFGQLGIAHQFCDDLVGTLHFLANDLNLFLHGRLALMHGAVEAKGGVGDDAQGILDLMGDLGRQPAGRAQPFLADG